MLTLYIADDEEEIRQGMASNIDWEAHGIEIGGLAGDGDEAIRLISRKAPDILLLDIKMPGLSGLEVAEWVQSHSPGCKTLILSGYDDFSYAQQALKSGVADYLLKPCRASDMLKAVLRVKQCIEEERAEDGLHELLKNQFEESIPALREKYLLDLMLKRQKAGSLELYHLYRISIEPRDIFAVLLMIGDKAMLGEQYRSEILLMKLAVRNILLELLGGDFPCELFEYNDDLVLLMNGGVDLDRVTGVLERAQAEVNERLWFRISVGVGNRYPDTDQIYLSYTEALQAAELCVFTNDLHVLRYDELAHRRGTPCNPGEAEPPVVEAIVSGDEPLFLSAVGHYTELLASTPSRKEVQESLTHLLIRLMQLSRAKGVHMDASFGRNGIDLEALFTAKSVDQIRSILTSIGAAILGGRDKGVPGNQIVARATEYIHAHYSSDITLETVAAQVYISPKYLSSLFKRSINTNFTDYIQHVRLQNACELLQGTRRMIYEIAAETGFGSEKYFSRIFKGQMGMTPSQFRNLHASGPESH